jgi:hypothetical protein
MDADTITPTALDRHWCGIGVTLLGRALAALAGGLTAVFGLRAHPVGRDVGLIARAGGMLRLRSPARFARPPLHALRLESGPSGAAVQVSRSSTVPDAAAARAGAAGGGPTEPPRDTPHGLREAAVASPEGVAFTAAVPLV